MVLVAKLVHATEHPLDVDFFFFFFNYVSFYVDFFKALQFILSIIFSQKKCISAFWLNKSSILLVLLWFTFTLVVN